MMMRRRRPLLGAAMIGGTAYAAGKSRANSAQREQDQEVRLQELEAQQGAAAPPPMAPPPPPAPAAPAPAAAPATDVVGKLTELKGLLDAGVLNQAEFEAAKTKLLAG